MNVKRSERLIYSEEFCFILKMCVCVQNTFSPMTFSSKCKLLPPVVIYGREGYTVFSTAYF